MNIYDKIYTNSPEYAKHYNNSVYYPIWKIAAKWVREPVLDIGCGPGQFAELLYNHGIKKYEGWDISEVAIGMAKAKTLGFDFVCVDALGLHISSHYQTVILLEVLEHIEQDLELVEQIPAGMQVIFSVPNFHSATHVRIFDSHQSAIERYKDLLNITGLYTHSFNNNTKIYLYAANRRTANME